MNADANVVDVGRLAEEIRTYLLNTYGEKAPMVALSILCMLNSSKKLSRTKTEEVITIIIADCVNLAITPIIKRILPDAAIIANKEAIVIGGMVLSFSTNFK